MAKNEEELKELVGEISTHISQIDPAPEPYEVVLSLLHVAIVAVARLKLLPEANLNLLFMEKSRNIYAAVESEQPPKSEAEAQGDASADGMDDTKNSAEEQDVLPQE